MGDDCSVEAMQRLAELAVVLGANVQPDQVVRVSGEAGHQELVRAVAEAAYRRGAQFVDVDLEDPYVHRSRVLHAPAHTLAYARTGARRGSGSSMTSRARTSRSWVPLLRTCSTISIRVV